ncbi:hypothetical protein Taro_048976 [Colocasia esculenta]|uniref:Uncharacterized protein n=1 Tax=Colocasia esculenta TaxID=4460 RepID=A0A843X9N5_COLES|nr:hypothetical protein [Colocasia esculenta]
MLMHMSSIHRTWRGVLKKRICNNIADRDKANRSHQSMPYRKGRKSHYQLKDDFVNSESGSTPISAEEAFVSVSEWRLRSYAQRRADETQRWMM